MSGSLGRWTIRKSKEQDINLSKGNYERGAQKVCGKLLCLPTSSSVLVAKHLAVNLGLLWIAAPCVMQKTWT